jgi:hypothetical protein
MDRDQTADGTLDDRNRMHLVQLDYLQHMLHQEAYPALAQPNQEKSAGGSAH